MDLFANRVISERQLIDSRTRYMADSLRYHSLSAIASAEGSKVYSPISGYIHTLDVSEGQYVETGQLLVTISSNKILLLRADIPQQYYYLLEDIVTANFRPAYADRTYSIEEFDGKIIAKGSSVAENDHYMPVHFEVKNDGSLLEGAFAEFYLKTRSEMNCLSVPVTAISEEQGAYYLYIQVSGESFTKRLVSTGENDGQRVQIVSGLDPGERIVTEGVMLLKAASLITGAPGHGHSH